MELVACHESYESICKRPTEVTSIPPDSYGCDAGQFEYQGSCYAIEHEHRTFSSAQAKCVQDGGNLITINDKDEQARLVSILAETFGTFFIGLSYNEQSQTFKWASGDYNSFGDAWDHYEPDLSFDDGGGGKCAVVSSEAPVGFWSVKKCSEPRAFICELPRAGYTNPPTTSTTVKPEAKCESYEWTKYNDHCYRYFETPKSFAIASEYCKSKGGDLVSFTDSSEEYSI